MRAGLQSALPFPVSVSGDASDKPQFTLSGKSGSVDTILHFATKADGLLIIELPHGDHDQKRAELQDCNGTLRVKPSTLKSLTAYGSGNICVNSSATSNDSFDLHVKGSGNTAIGNAPFKSLKALIEGSGNTQVKGSSISSADVECRGSGNFALGGAEGPVKVSMKGSGNTNIIGSDSVKISGDVKGTANVSYNKGSCSMTSVIPGNNPCQQVADLSMPEDVCDA